MPGNYCIRLLGFGLSSGAGLVMNDLSAIINRLPPPFLVLPAELIFPVCTPCRWHDLTIFPLTKALVPHKLRDPPYLCLTWVHSYKSLAHLFLTYALPVWRTLFCSLMLCCALSKICIADSSHSSRNDLHFQCQAEGIPLCIGWFWNCWPVNPELLCWTCSCFMSPPVWWTPAVTRLPRGR